MIKIPHAITIVISAGIGFILLWLERIYSSRPLYEGLVLVSESNFIVTAAHIVSAATTPAIFVIVCISGAVVAAHEHHAKLWWLLVGLILLGIAISGILKGLIMLPRPNHALIQLSTYGFPSTHATVATIIFLVGTWLIYHWKNFSHRLAAAIIMATSWILISISRILLGVHSLSDVLAGILLGTAIAAVALACMPYILKYYDISVQTFKEQ